MRMINKYIWLKGFVGGQKGAAAAEFAMVIPILIIILVAILDFGRLMMDYQTASKSIRDASRYLSRVGITCVGGVGTVDNAQDVVIARNLALSGTVNTPSVPGDYLIADWTNPNSISVDIVCINNGGQYSGLYEGIDEIPSLTVSAIIPFTMFFGTMVYDQAQINFSTSTNMANFGE